MTLRIRKILIIGLLLGFNFLAVNFIYHTNTHNEIFKIQYRIDKAQNKVDKIIADTLKKPSYDYLKSVTVHIILKTYKRNTGTGVIVKIDENYTYVLTNAHLARGEEAKVYVKNGGKEILASEVKCDDLFDLALVKIKGKLKDKTTIKGIAFAKPQDRVFLVGHPMGLGYIYGEGVFAGYEGVSEIIQIPTVFGNSGSGVFNKDGKLVSLIHMLYGINSFTYDTTHGIAISGTTIRRFLEEVGVYELQN